MIRRLDLRGRDLSDRRAVAALLPRAELDVTAATDVVVPICAAVRLRGAAAVNEYSTRFDGATPAALRVPAQVLTAALKSLDQDVRAALVEAVRRTRLVHETQRRPDVATQVVPGGRVTDRWRPVQRVGLYVPGGQAVYPSSVVMNVVPAQVAGVPSIAVTSPPQADNAGWPHPTILAAAALLGVDEVYAAGGAQAIAMLAYGVDGCPAVDLITGPGNAYVAAAKRLLRGVVGIDAEAGPTEIAIIADDTADARHVAADLISQAEHDTAAAAILVTSSAALADAVDAELVRLVAATKHQERVRVALGGRQSAIVLVDDVEAAVQVADAYAAEHLEIHTRDARAVAEAVTNAGAIFVGAWSPVSLGDYYAGSNHVLPTGGCAAHSSGLSVQTFLRGTQVIEYDEDALRAAAAAVTALADAEDLPAHGAAVRERLVGQPIEVPRARAAELPLRTDLRGRTPYGAPQLDVPVRLNTNENPHPPSPALVAELATAVAAAAASLNRYPDRGATALRADLASYLRAATGVELGIDQVWAANGSNEVLQQLLMAFAGSGRAALGFEPSYSMHHTLAATTGTRWIAVAREGDFGLAVGPATAAILLHRPAITFLTSPNNPTGSALALDVIAAVYDAAQANGPSMLVVDEAYAEFARPGTPSAITLLAGRPYLVVTRTMSKAFALAGARLGYLAAHGDVVGALQLVRLPYHLSALTQAAARVALAHAPDLLASVGAVVAERDRLSAAMTARGLPVVASDANFVLVGGLGDEAAVWRGLVERGVLVRDVGLPGWLRVTAGLSSEVDAFLAALDGVLATMASSPTDAEGDPR